MEDLKRISLPINLLLSLILIAVIVGIFQTEETADAYIIDLLKNKKTILGKYFELNPKKATVKGVPVEITKWNKLKNKHVYSAHKFIHDTLEVLLDPNKSIPSLVITKMVQLGILKLQDFLWPDIKKLMSNYKISMCGCVLRDDKIPDLLNTLKGRVKAVNIDTIVDPLLKGKPEDDKRDIKSKMKYNWAGFVEGITHVSENLNGNLPEAKKKAVKDKINIFFADPAIINLFKEYKDYINSYVRNYEPIAYFKKATKEMVSQIETLKKKK